MAIHRAADGISSGVPHSFDVDALLDFGERTLAQSVDLRDRHELLTDLAIAFGLSGDDQRSDALLREGLDTAETDSERARMHYLVGHQYHQRRGEWREAIESFERATHLIQAASTVRARAYLNLASVCVELDEFDRARTAANAALSTNIREIEPHARLRLSIAHARHGDVKAAFAENRAAQEQFGELKSEMGELQTNDELVRLHFQTGEPDKALPVIETLRKRRFELLDLEHLGRHFHDEATALWQLDRLDEARDAYLQALRYHHGPSRDVYVAATLRHLGAVVDELGERDAALAMMHEAAMLAIRAESPAEEFLALCDALRTVERRQHRLDVVPYLLSRCHSVVESAAPRVDRDVLVAFAKTTASLARLGAEMPHGGTVAQPADFPDPVAAERARHLCTIDASSELDELLTERLDTEIHVRRAPRLENLKAFLMGWAGSWFGNSDYREEFGLPPETSKYQLRLLRDSGIIRQIGQRKATRYLLGFHLNARELETAG